MLFRVPDGESPFDRFILHGDLTHISTLSKGRFIHLAKLTELEVVSCANAYMVTDPSAR